MRTDVYNIVHTPEGTRRPWRDWGKAIRFEWGPVKERIGVSFLFRLWNWEWDFWHINKSYVRSTAAYVGPLGLIYSRIPKK